MVLINRFGQNFVQNYVEFNGGGRGSNSRAKRVCGRPVPKPSGGILENYRFVYTVYEGGDISHELGNVAHVLALYFRQICYYHMREVKRTQKTETLFNRKLKEL